MYIIFKVLYTKQGNLKLYTGSSNEPEEKETN